MWAQKQIFGLHKKGNILIYGITVNVLLFTTFQEISVLETISFSTL